MKSFVALLRGINVGGKVIVPMAELKKLIEAEGLAEVQTLLQSGNVVFKGEGTTAALETKLEKAAVKKFGRDIVFVIRTGAEWKKIVAANPYPDEAKNDPGRFVLVCLKTKPEASAYTALKAAIVGREYFEPGDQCFYAYYPDGQADTKFTTAVIDRKLATTATARNWNTVLKIAERLD